MLYLVTISKCNTTEPAYNTRSNCDERQHKTFKQLRIRFVTLVQSVPLLVFNVSPKKTVKKNRVPMTQSIIKATLRITNENRPW